MPKVENIICLCLQNLTFSSYITGGKEAVEVITDNTTPLLETIKISLISYRLQDFKIYSLSH